MKIMIMVVAISKIGKIVIDSVGMELFFVNGHSVSSVW